MIDQNEKRKDERRQNKGGFGYNGDVHYHEDNCDADNVDSFESDHIMNPDEGADVMECAGDVFTEGATEGVGESILEGVGSVIGGIIGGLLEP